MSEGTLRTSAHMSESTSTLRQTCGHKIRQIEKYKLIQKQTQKVVVLNFHYADKYLRASAHV